MDNEDTKNRVTELLHKNTEISFFNRLLYVPKADVEELRKEATRQKLERKTKQAEKESGMSLRYEISEEEELISGLEVMDED